MPDTADTLLKFTPHHIIGGAIGKEDDHRHELQGEGALDAAPIDPVDINSFEIYWKKIDDNNNGLFIKGKKNGVIVEALIF